MTTTPIARRLNRLLAIALFAIAIVSACNGDNEAAATRIASLEDWASDYCHLVSDWTSESNGIDIVIGDPDQFEAEQQRISTRWPAVIEDSERTATALRSIDPPAEVEQFHAATAVLIDDYRGALTDSLPAVIAATDADALSDAALELQRRQQSGRRSATYDEFQLNEDVRDILDRTPGCGFASGTSPATP